MKQTELIKQHIANSIFEQFKAIFNDFSDDDYETAMLKKIARLDPEEIAKVANVSSNMANKYKRGDNCPTLDGAVLLEEHFSIPAKYWVKHRNIMRIGK